MEPGHNIMTWLFYGYAQVWNAGNFFGFFSPLALYSKFYKKKHFQGCFNLSGSYCTEIYILFNK